MQIFTYKGCQTCLVKSSCRNVCREYRNHVFDTRGIDMKLNPLPLDRAETIVAMHLATDSHTLKVNEKEYVINLITDIVGVV